MRIRLLAVDLDGTLTAKLPVVPVETVRALKEAIDKKVTVVLTTGRDYETAIRLARQLKLNGPVVCYQGALIRDSLSGETLLSDYLSLEMSRRIIKFARVKKLPMVMYMTHDNFTEFPSLQMKETYEDDGVSLTTVNNLLTLLEEDQKPIKFLFIQPKGHTKKVYQLVQPEFGRELTVTRSSNTLVETFSPSVSKGRALQLVANYLQIPLEQTMAIGDHDNDISMVELAGLGVAMENGSVQVKAVADVIAPPVQAAGAAWAIRKYILDENHDHST
jgi:Cof subfamily protein (haloacid dehalogenase superfamily)